MSRDKTFPHERRHASDTRRCDVPLGDWPGPMSAYFTADGKDKAAAAAASEKRRRYLVNKFALEQYHEGKSHQAVNVELKKRFGVEMAEGTVWKMHKRAVTIDQNTGKICGFWACVPHWRPSTNRTKINAQHHLSSLFAKYPKVEAAMCAFVLKRTTGPEMRPVSTLRVHMVWEQFLYECKLHTNRHIEKAWPFNEPRAGYEAVRRWFSDKRFLHPAAAAQNQLPVDLAKQVISDYSSAKSITAPAAHISVAYSETQLDEHRMDQMWTLMVPGREPDEFVAVHTKRLWALCMVECSSTAILSSAVAFGQAYVTADVLRLIHDALIPPRRPERLRLSQEEWCYREDAAYPGEHSEFARNSWMSLAMDRHATHRAALADAMEVTRCQVVSGKPGTPEVRSTIERFFSHVARSAEWFESAVGNRPSSPARRDPEGGALASVVYMPLAAEYLDLVCRNYNVTPQLALDGNTPLGRLKHLAAKNRIFRSPVGEFGTGNLFRLLPRYTARLGRRRSKELGSLCVYFQYSCYYGPELSSAQHLMFGSTTEVDIYPQEDARFAFVVPRAFPEQVFQVVCGGRWRLTPHLLTERRLSHAASQRILGKDASVRPLLGVGLARGLAQAASTHEGMARLVSNMVAFMDRFGAGAVPYIDMTPQQTDELLQFVEKAAPDDARVEELPVGAYDGVHASVPVTPANPFGLIGE